MARTAVETDPLNRLGPRWHIPRAGLPPHTAAQAVRTAVRMMPRCRPVIGPDRPLRSFLRDRHERAWNKSIGPRRRLMYSGRSIVISRAFRWVMVMS